MLKEKLVAAKVLVCKAVPPVAASYNLKMPEVVPVAVNVTAPDPHLDTAATVGVAGSAVKVTTPRALKVIGQAGALALLATTE
jgi:hypothetical protein